MRILRLKFILEKYDFIEAWVGDNDLLYSTYSTINSENSR